ncbi:MAG: endolytic transglycosylase MltG, partial [Lachnospiraceae bacterium]|nr:endolytic transglycosylase MltG [Lachnospiraceae bacterium]
SGSDGSEPEGDGVLSGSDGSATEGDGVLSGSDGGEPEGNGALPGSDGSGDGEDGMGTQKSDSAGTEDGDVPAFASPKEGMITVEIEEGMDSYTISVILEEAGLIEKAYDFDQYLCNNLYSRKIVNGTYHIPAGISQEELAKIITREK